MSYKPRVVLIGNHVGIAVGTKMDPNYVVVDFYLPAQQDRVVVHISRLTFTPLTPADILRFNSFADFQQTYPEYFI